MKMISSLAERIKIVSMLAGERCKFELFIGDAVDWMFLLEQTW